MPQFYLAQGRISRFSCLEISAARLKHLVAFRRSRLRLVASYRSCDYHDLLSTIMMRAVLSCASRRVVTLRILPSAFRVHPGFQKCSPEGGQSSANDLLKMDIDAAEKHMKHWITTLQARMEFYLQQKRGEKHQAHKWGFVLYRLTYDLTDEEWTPFMDKLKADFSGSGSGLRATRTFRPGQVWKLCMAVTLVSPRVT